MVFDNKLRWDVRVVKERVLRTLVEIRVGSIPTPIIRYLTVTLQ
jgi:hypothetical protein